MDHSKGAAHTSAYNFAKQLEAIRFKGPYEAIDELSKLKREVFIIQPSHHNLRLNNYYYKIYY